MGERKGTNHYYPPDFDPKKHFSLNAYHGTHALRERARKLDKGILIIRFELPYNIWCGGCGNHVGMGVRYNAEKKKVGNYYTTPIYRFRMKCHLCDNRFEIETDPKNCDYVIVSGARRKEERWEPSATETIEMQEKEEKEKLMTDAMFKLEHGVQDKVKLKAVVPTLNKIVEVQTQWKDDFAINQLARKKFRGEKKELQLQKQADDALIAKGSLDIQLVEEMPEDVEKAARIRFRNQGFGGHQRKRRQDINSKSIFKTSQEEQAKRKKTIENRLQMKITPKKAGVDSAFGSAVNSKTLANKLGIVTKVKQDSVGGNFKDTATSVSEVRDSSQLAEDEARTSNSDSIESQASTTQHECSSTKSDHSKQRQLCNIIPDEDRVKESTNGVNMPMESSHKIDHESLCASSNSGDYRTNHAGPGTQRDLDESSCAMEEKECKLKDRMQERFPERDTDIPKRDSSSVEIAISAQSHGKEEQELCTDRPKQTNLLLCDYDDSSEHSSDDDMT